MQFLIITVQPHDEFPKEFSVTDVLHQLLEWTIEGGVTGLIHEDLIRGVIRHGNAELIRMFGGWHVLIEVSFTDDEAVAFYLKWGGEHPMEFLDQDEWVPYRAELLTRLGKGR